MVDYGIKYAASTLFCIAVILSLPALGAAETIYFKDGKFDRVNILSRRQGTLWVARHNGSVGIPTYSIRRIENDDGTLSKYDYENITALIQLLIREREYEQAIEWCDRLVESVPDYLTIRSLRAALYQKLGNLKAATDDYSFLINKESADAAIFNDQGVIFAKENDTVRAKECFLEAIRQKPLLAEPHGNLAGIYMKQKDYSRAIEEYTQVLSVEPSNVSALYYLGIAYRDIGDVAKARAAWEKVLSVSPGDVKAQRALAESQG